MISFENHVIPTWDPLQGGPEVMIQPPADVNQEDPLKYWYTTSIDTPSETKTLNHETEYFSTSETFPITTIVPGVAS
jgi:hypothetical protein